MEIVYWAPEGKVLRIYFNIPRQKLVSVWMEPITPSQGYRWDHRIKFATNAFTHQPELRQKLVHAVHAYVLSQLNWQLEKAAIKKRLSPTWSPNAAGWADLVAAQRKLGVMRTKQPQQIRARPALALPPPS